MVQHTLHCDGCQVNVLVSNQLRLPDDWTHVCVTQAVDANGNRQMIKIDLCADCTARLPTFLRYSGKFYPSKCSGRVG